MMNPTCMYCHVTKPNERITACIGSSYMQLAQAQTEDRKWSVIVVNADGKESRKSPDADAWVAGLERTCLHDDEHGPHFFHPLCADQERDPRDAYSNRLTTIATGPDPENPGCKFFFAHITPSSLSNMLCDSCCKHYITGGKAESSKRNG